MRNISVCILLLLAVYGNAQTEGPLGLYVNRPPSPVFTIRFLADSTFDYMSQEHPCFYRWEGFQQKGKWSKVGDTIILNPNLPLKPFVECDFREAVTADTGFVLVFHHVKRYFDSSGLLVRSDTLPIEQLDYAFNTLKKKNLTRVATHHTTRCTFAGYIPREVITSNSTIAIARPAESPQKIFIGCYELQETRPFTISDPQSNHFSLIVFSNYYSDGQLRQKKILVKNDKILYTHQKANGKFETDIWSGAVLRKQNEVRALP